MPEHTDPPADNTRYFIVNLGRCGSSLLAAVLADGGADFGLPVPDQWDPRTGQMESAAIKQAAHHYRRAYDIGQGRKFLISPVLEQKYRLRRGRSLLRRALQAARFVKIGDLDLVVQPGFKLGYVPRVILSYRQFEPMLPSLIVGRTHVGPGQLASEYVRIYRQGLALLHAFGGCAIEYNELLRGDSRGWAEALSRITGFDAQGLIAARDARVNGSPDPEDIEPLYPEADAVFRTMRTLSGHAVAPSRQVERAAAGNKPDQNQGSNHRSH